MGFKQEYGVGYTEMITKPLRWISCHHTVFHFDVKTPFLYGDLLTGFEILATFASFESPLMGRGKHQGCKPKSWGTARSDQEVSKTLANIYIGTDWFKTQQSVFSVNIDSTQHPDQGKCDDEARYHSAVGAIMFAATLTLS
jgi:hypothetical protein